MRACTSSAPRAAPTAAPLELNGVDLETLAVAIDGEPVAEKRLAYGDEILRIAGCRRRQATATRVRIRPQDNTSLEGLYRSRGLFCTQCEAEGFPQDHLVPGPPGCHVRPTAVTIDA
jgi:aminopeptidase N